MAKRKTRKKTFRKRNVASLGEDVWMNEQSSEQLEECIVTEISDEETPLLRFPSGSHKISSRNKYFEPNFKHEESVMMNEENKEAYSVDMHRRLLNIMATVQGNIITIWKVDEKMRILHRIINGNDKNNDLYCVRWGVWKEKDVLAVCGEAQFVNIYQVNIKGNEEVSVKLIGHLTGHGNSVYTLCFHPFMNGQILTGSVDTSIRLWDLNLNFETVAIFDGSLAGILSLSFHSSGDFFVSGSMDNTCRIYHIDEEVRNYIRFKTEYHLIEKATSANHPLSIYNTKLMGSTNCMANTEIKPLRLPIKKSSVTNRYHKGYVDSCIFVGDMIFSKTTLQMEESTNDPGDVVLVWTPDSVAEGADFNKDMKEDEISILHRFKGRRCMLWWLKMSISDRYLARPLNDGTVEIFDLEQVGLCFHTTPCEVLTHPDYTIRECVFSHDGSMLFVLQDNGLLSRWSLIPHDMVDN